MISPVETSMACTFRAVEAETKKVLPSGDIAEWSDLKPSIGVRQTIYPEFTSIATTSAKLGLDT